MSAVLAVEDVLAHLRSRYGTPSQFGNSRLLRFSEQLTCSVNYSKLLRGHRYFFGLAKEVVDETVVYPETSLGEFVLLVCGASDTVLVLPRFLVLRMMQGVASRKVDIFCTEGSYVMQTTQHPKLDVTQYLNAYPATKSHSTAPILESDAPMVSREHVKMQWALMQLGKAEGCSVWVPPGDRSLSFNRTPFRDLTLDKLPNLGIDDQTRKIVQNIDVLWLRGSSIQRAFEVESTTSVYSGILRLNDLVIAQPNTNIELYIAARESRRQRVFTQLLRPSFQHLLPKCAFISFETLERGLTAIDGFREHQGVRITGLIQGEYFERPEFWTYPVEA